MSGPGERCQFCSGNEASQVEHFRPKAVFPDLAMTWGNFLWACAICNGTKGDRFPPDTEPGAPLIDPTCEDPWQFFYIDEFGSLCPVWNPELDMKDPRAENTIRLLNLDRDALQQSREDRLAELKQNISDTLELFKLGIIDTHVLRRRHDNWKTSALHPDVTNYFLAGPGQNCEPFLEFRQWMDSTTP